MKKVLALLLCAVMLIACASCGKDNKDDPDTGEGTSYTAFIDTMTVIKGYGDKMSELYMPVQSEYYYSFAGASVGALRYAVEYILYLRGEGTDLASFTKDSKYSGFDRIAELNYSSPYPSYFEGLILDMQGKTNEAQRPYAIASIMPQFPEEGLDFWYLKTMEISKLYELRDSLRAFENSLYEVYAPRLTGGEWNRNYFDTEYLVASIHDALNAKDTAKAKTLVNHALKVDPFDVLVWRSAVLVAIGDGDLETAGAYLDEGLSIFPNDEMLLGFKQGIVSAAEEVGQ